MISLQGQEKHTPYETALILLLKYVYLIENQSPLIWPVSQSVPLEHCQELHFQFLPGG